jgi:hypothetical protein
MLERSGDNAFRNEAERVIDILARNAHNATFYAGVSRLYLPEEKVVMLAREFSDQNIFAQVDQKGGYYIIEINLPELSERIMGTRVEMGDLNRVGVRHLIRNFLKTREFRSFLTHELIHVMMRKRNVEYTMNSDEWVDYANYPEELSAWFNQAVYELVHRAKSDSNPRQVLGYDAAGFADRIVRFLLDNHLWDSYSEESRRRVLKRAYTGYDDAIREVIASRTSQR